MKWLIILLTLISDVYACENVEIVFDNKKYSACIENQKTEKFYFSKKCKNILDCFDLGSVKELSIYPNQNPKFTLCYKLKGKPGFSLIKGEKRKIPICLLDNNLVDLNYLIYSFQNSALEK